MSSIKEILFFICSIVLYAVSVKTLKMWKSTSNANSNYVLIACSVAYVLILIGLFAAFGLKSEICASNAPIIVREKYGHSDEEREDFSEMNVENEPANGDPLAENSPIDMCSSSNTQKLLSDPVVSVEAQCKGGSYMWQGDSVIARKCRALASTKEGQCAIGRYNCPSEFQGKPQKYFEYTAQTNDQWKNEQCALIGKNYGDARLSTEVDVCTSPMCSVNY